MKSFAIYLDEAKFRSVPNLRVIQSNKIADEYLKQISQLTPADEKEYKRRKLSVNWQEYFNYTGDNVWFLLELNSVSFKDLQTDKMTKYKVYVAFGQNNKNYALCNTESHFIIIYDDTCRSLSKEKLVSTILHEITHGFQQHKEYTNKYKKLLKQETPTAKKAADKLYHKQPNEFDAFTTELAHTITTEYSRLKNDIINAKMVETKKIMEKRLEKFLLELNLFISSPLENYFIYKELPLPASLNTFEDMLKSIQEEPRLWKSFKTKLNNLYDTLSAQK